MAGNTAKPMRPSQKKYVALLRRFAVLVQRIVGVLRGRDVTAWGREWVRELVRGLMPGGVPDLIPDLMPS